MTSMSIDEELLPKGLSAIQVCEQFFLACESKNPQRWLNCLHLTTRSAASSLTPGPFDACQWELGRTRAEKSMAKYTFIRQVGDQQLKGLEPIVILEFQPVYGPVPGHEEGSKLGLPIHLTVQKQGGASSGEWRILAGAF